jgi:hypothetical protein
MLDKHHTYTMKLTTLTTVALLGAASTLVAGPMSSGKDGKVTVTQPPVETGCDAFNGGLAVSAYGLFLTPDAEVEDDTFGGGLGVEYFFNQYFGVAGSAQWADPGSGVVHNYSADAVVRYPITSICIAPYAFGGVGYHTNSHNEVIGRAGAGLDVRLWDANGIFADWTYTFPGGDLEDYQLIRFGVKFAF